MSRVSLKGSEKTAIPNATAVTGKGGAPNPDEIIEVTLSVQRKNALPDWSIESGAMSHEQLEQDHGISDEDMATIEAFAQEYNLTLTEHSPVVHMVKLAGSVTDMEKAFGSKLQHVRLGNTIYRQREGE